MANEKVKIELPVVPTLDKRAARNVTTEIRDLERNLGPIKVSFDDLAKTASSSVQQLNKVSSAAAAMGKGIESAVKKSNKAIGDLQKGLKGVQAGAGGGGGGGASEDLSDAEEDLIDSTEKLSDAMSDLAKNTKTQVDIAKRAAKAQSDFAKAMKVRGKEKFEGFGDVMKDLPNLFKKGGLSGGVKGVSGGVGKMFGATSSGPTAGAKAVSSASAGGGAAGAGGMASAASAIMKAGPYIAAAAAAIMAIAKILQMASESQVKINKGLLEGIGFANDFGVSVAGYRDGIDELRDAVQDTSYVMLKFGGNSETTAKIINRFTKEATGSLMQTRNELSQMPGGLQENVAAMAKAATAYGKALGMEAEDAAAMMGKFKNELGYSAQGSMDAMQNIVKAAAQSNMPMTKFMGIFNSVIPDVELYQNRLEELTSTIKLLSKTMSAKDVKNFMDAFSKGFKGTDFKQRLKTVLVAGTENVSKALESDFDSKARSMAKNFKEYGIDEDEFTKAMKGGEGSMAALLNKAQASASQQGKQLGGSQVSDAMKLASYEATRKKGGALNVATAMSGGGTMATYKILSKFGGTLTKGFDGISEHVMKQLGISEQQYEALRTTSQSLKVQKDMLKTYGKTNSKSMNQALRETVKLRKQGMSEKDIDDAMKDATDDELFAASERQQADQKGQEKAFNLAEEQYNVTTSIGDKLDNVIAFLLEQVLRVLNPVLDVLNDMLMWLMDGDKKAMKATQDMADSIKFTNRDKMKEEIKDKDGKGTGKFKSTGVGESVDLISGAIQKGLASGKTGKDLASSVAKSGAIDANALQSLSTNDIMNLAKRAGGSGKDILNKFQGAQKRGDTEGMLKALDPLGDMDKSLMELTKMMAEQGISTQAGKDKAGGIQTSRPGGTASMTAQQRTAAIQAGQASDIEVLGDPVAASGAGAPLMTEQARQAVLAAKSSGATTAPAGASGVATPAGGGAPASAVKDTHAAIQDTAKTQQQAAKTVDQQLAVQDETYGVMNDVASILKKGIKYESSWMGTKYKNILKEATLDSFRQSLMEFAVLQVKLEKDSKLKDALAGSKGMDFALSGMKGLDAVLNSDAGKGTEALADQNLAGFATGGSVDYDQMARVHAGEFVVPKGGMLVKGGGDGGGKTVNVNATINVTTDADPKQIAAAVHDLYRQH